MIPTAEEVRRMSIDARGTHRPPAPTPPPAQSAPATPLTPARAHSTSKKPGATGGNVAGARGDHRPDRRAHPRRRPDYPSHATHAHHVRPCFDLCRERLCSRWW